MARVVQVWLGETEGERWERVARYVRSIYPDDPEMSDAAIIRRALRLVCAALDGAALPPETPDAQEDASGRYDRDKAAGRVSPAEAKEDLDARSAERAGKKVT